MKIALIAPPYPLEENPSPPLGISYVAAILERAGAEVVILDYIVRQYSEEKLKNEIQAFGPEVVGINAVSINYYSAIEIIKKVKAIDPQIITMMGGPHVTFDWENTLNNCPDLDLTVIGEGEITLQEILPVIKDRTAWKEIKGIAFSDSGTAYRTEPRELVTDLDSLPFPARHLLPMSRYRALGYPVNIITSRGCPGRCIFCVGRRMVGKKLRNRNPALVVDEMEQILGLGFDRINIADDCFTTNKKRVRALCEEIHRRNLNFAWSAFVRADTINVDCLQTMKDAGCDTVSFGVESGNPEMLKRIKKGITLDTVRRAADYCNQVGMKVFASYLVGLPGETHQTLQDSHSFATEIGIDYGYHFLAPFPGTIIREQQDEFDIDILTDNWNLYDANRAITKSSHVTAEDLERFVYTTYTKVGEEEFQESLNRYNAGNPSDEDFFKVAGKQSMELIFKLLSEDIIEECCFPSLENMDAEHLFLELTGELEKKTNVDFLFILSTVKRLFDNGCLKYKTEGNITQWFWTHNNKVDALLI